MNRLMVAENAAYAEQTVIAHTENDWPPNALRNQPASNGPNDPL